MRSFLATSWLSRWGVRLPAFGIVVAIAAYAAGDPKPVASQGAPQGAPHGGGLPSSTGTVSVTNNTGAMTPEMLQDARLASLRSRATADAKRIHALEVSVKNLEYAVAHLPKPPPSTAPFCGNAHTSQNPQGGMRDCSPYRCDGATGICMGGSCANVDDCIEPYVCDSGHHCVSPPVNYDSGDN